MKQQLSQKQRLPSHSAGFTIIELAIVLTVVAMIAGGALAVGASRIEASKISATNDRIGFLMEAIDMYVKQYCHLPCPADPFITSAEPEFGLAAFDTGTSPITCLADAHLARDAATNVVAGAVPARTLLIAPALMLDGWGRKFTYVVDEQLVDKGDGVTNGFSNPNVNGEIEVDPNAGGTAVSTEVAVLILSHGSNGHGAWRSKGGIRLDKDSTDASEQANSWDGDGVAGDGAFDNVFVQKFNTSTFDDVVEYRTKWQLPESGNCTN